MRRSAHEALRVRSVGSGQDVLDVNIRKVARALEGYGLYDRRGRLRVGWITRLESLITTALSIDQTLGLERRAKNVTDTFDQAIADFSEAYADQAERDHAALLTAIKDGRVQAQTGV